MSVMSMWRWGRRCALLCLLLGADGDRFEIGRLLDRLTSRS
jgi:hypothetical protein